MGAAARAGCLRRRLRAHPLGTTGPLVDGIHASEYGFIAFVTGRGFHGLLALAPMLLGAALGAAAARRLGSTIVLRTGWRRAGAYLRRGVAGLTAVALVALAAAVAAPASTDPIVDADGETTARQRRRAHPGRDRRP